MPNTDLREADAMRRLTFGMNLSLDGYIAAPGDDLGWSVPSDERFQWWSDRVGGDGPGAVRAQTDGTAINPNAVKLRSWPVEDIDLWRGVVFDDLVVGVFDVGVADGDSADHSRTGSEAAFR
jgi:hypothetical protein